MECFAVKPLRQRIHTALIQYQSAKFERTFADGAEKELAKPIVRLRKLELRFMRDSATELGDALPSPRRIRRRLEDDHAYREHRIRAAR